MWLRPRTTAFIFAGRVTGFHLDTSRTFYSHGGCTVPPPSFHVSPLRQVRGQQRCTKHVIQRCATTGSMLASTRRLHTSALHFAATTSESTAGSSGTLTRPSIKTADDLLSKLSQRSAAGAAAKISSPAETLDSGKNMPAVSRSALSQAELKDDTGNSIRIEDLLAFDDEEIASVSSGEQQRVSTSSEASCVHDQHADNTAATLSPQGVSLKRSSSSTAAAAAAAARSPTAADVEDADSYGMAGQTTGMSDEVLMETLLQEALADLVRDLNADEERGGENRDVGDEEEEEGAEASVSVVTDMEAVMRADDSAVPAAAAALLSNTSNNRPSDVPIGNVMNADSDDTSIAEALASDATKNDTEEHEEEEEETSVDAVLEEETERMFRAALANMSKDGRSASTTPGTAAQGGSAITDGYTFFSKEAVMAAAESLAAPSAATASFLKTRVDRNGGATSSSSVPLSEMDGEAALHFDDDALRVVEMETLGLDMESSRR